MCTWKLKNTSELTLIVNNGTWKLGNDTGSYSLLLLSEIHMYVQLGKYFNS